MQVLAAESSATPQPNGLQRPGLPQVLLPMWLFAINNLAIGAYWLSATGTFYLKMSCKVTGSDGGNQGGRNRLAVA